jgi:diadenosine tetraphosphatase ApaH/serine/threonine PP2A family protein phosphatase
MNPDRRSAQLAAVIGAVLACYAGSATAIEFEFENGGKLNWNTTVSVGASWRAEHPSEQLFTRADGSLIGLYSSPLIPGTPVGPRDGLAGNHAAGDGNLNYAKNDRFSTPFKVITDIEYKKGRFGALLRAKYWYDQALNQENVLIGSQANNYNGVRPGLGPVPGFTICNGQTPPGAACLPISPPGQNLWPKGKLSDRGFEAEQQFENVLLLDAYVYGSFAVGNTDLQLRVGNQVINWGESIFIQGVNQVNPIDVPAARRAGAELKEILLPVWAVYANWGFDFGSLEAFYQLQWNNTSVDGCGTYFTATSTLISADPGSCNSITVVGGHLGNPAPGTQSPIVPQLGSQAFQQGAAGTYVPAIQGREPSDSGQFGLAFRFPVDKIDTEIGLYAMNIHSRLPVAASVTGTNWKDLPAAQQAALTAAGLIGTDSYGNYWITPGSTTRLRSLMPGPEAYFEGYLASPLVNLPTNLESGKGFWEYPEDIQIYGISAATNLLGWSTSAELSYQVDVPVMVNGNDLIGAGVLGIGPYREIARAVQAQSEGTYLVGHSLFNKTQFQVNAVKTFSNVLGAENMLVVGEIGSQWNDVPDYTKGGIRYGRGFMYGTGSGPGYFYDPNSPSGQPGLDVASAGDFCSPTYSGLPVPAANRFYNPQPNGCRNDGYVTDVAWGYRLRVSADYNNVMNSGVTVTPSVFWAHDVEGVSMDPTFIEDRMTLGLGVKFNYNKKYVLDLNYVSYDNDNFDPLFDRDYYSAAVSVTF